MDSFQPSGRMFVLGAGASAFAGYPLANGLLSFVRNFNTRDIRGKEIASEIFGKLNDAETHFKRLIVHNEQENANLEELLTYLELYHSFPGTVFHLNPWTSRDSGAVRRVVTDRFLEYQYDLNKALDPGAKQPQHRRFRQLQGRGRKSFELAT